MASENKEKRIRFSDSQSKRLVELINERKSDMIDKSRSRLADANRKRNETWKEVVDIMNRYFKDFKCDVSSAKSHWMYLQCMKKKDNATTIKMRKRKWMDSEADTLVSKLMNVEDTAALGDTTTFSQISGAGVESSMGGTPPPTYGILQHGLNAFIEATETITALAKRILPDVPAHDMGVEQLNDDAELPIIPLASFTDDDRVHYLQIKVLQAQLANQKKIREICGELMSVTKKYGAIANNINKDQSQNSETDDDFD